MLGAFVGVFLLFLPGLFCACGVFVVVLGGVFFVPRVTKTFFLGKLDI